MKWSKWLKTYSKIVIYCNENEYLVHDEIMNQTVEAFKKEEKTKLFQYIDYLLDKSEQLEETN